MSLFYDYCNRENITAETITFDESIFIKNSSTGALIYSNNTYVGPIYNSYDIISFYPSITRCDKLKIPIKQWIFKTLSVSEFEKFKNTFFPYGIYIYIRIGVELHQINQWNYIIHTYILIIYYFNWKMERNTKPGRN